MDLYSVCDLNKIKVTGTAFLWIYKGQGTEQDEGNWHGLYMDLFSMGDLNKMKVTGTAFIWIYTVWAI